MAKKTAQPRRKKRRAALKALFALLILALLLLGGMHVSSRVLFVRYAAVALADLPEAFAGARVLFLSDLDVTSAREASATARLLKTLRALEPDLLLLGGDYANPALWDRLNGVEDWEEMSALRRTVFAALEEFEAPLGKFAVAGDGDALPQRLKEELAAAGVRLLSDEAVRLERGGQAISVVGLSDASLGATDFAALGGRFRAEDAVIAFTHSPQAFVGAQTTEAANGGAWVDLMLAGHTHGGQIRLFGRTLLNLTEHESRYLDGWRKEGGAFLLTSEGVGCEGAALRLGTRPEVHIITLTRPNDE